MKTTRFLLAASLSLAATAAWAAPSPAVDAAPLAGTWVSSEVKRALDRGQWADVGCHLSISAEPLYVDEICGDLRRAWEGDIEVAKSRGRLELHVGALRIVSRAGTPNELELTSSEGLRRLYRILPLEEETLADWVQLGARLSPQEAEVAEDEVEAGVEAAKGEVEDLHVPIAQPIQPKPRICGCGAAEGSLAGVALLIAAAWAARRQGARSRV